MSMPYFVHKDDEKLYEEYRLKHLDIDKRARESYIDIPEGSAQAHRDEMDRVEDLFSAERKALNEAYPIRFKSIFDKVDRSQYNAYFLGHKMDDKFGRKMLGIAYKGVDGCAKAIRGEK